MNDKLDKLEDIKASINVNEIEEQISKIKSYKTFTLLNQKQQEAFKFALFLPNSSEAYKKVLGFLRTDLDLTRKKNVGLGFSIPSTIQIQHQVFIMMIVEKKKGKRSFVYKIILKINLEKIKKIKKLMLKLKN